MVDFNRVNDVLENGVEDEKEEVKIELITLSGIQNYTIEAGMTVKEFKETYDLDNVKIVNEDGDVMTSLKQMANTSHQHQRKTVSLLVIKKGESLYFPPFARKEIRWMLQKEQNF